MKYLIKIWSDLSSTIWQLWIGRFYIFKDLQFLIFKDEIICVLHKMDLVVIVFDKLSLFRKGCWHMFVCLNQCKYFWIRQRKRIWEQAFINLGNKERWSHYCPFFLSDLLRTNLRLQRFGQYNCQKVFDYLFNFNCIFCFGAVEKWNSFFQICIR